MEHLHSLRDVCVQRTARRMEGWPDALPLHLFFSGLCCSTLYTFPGGVCL